MFPILALVASYEMADTNVRPHQPGVFAYDPYNRETWTLGVGFKIDFQWELQDAKAAKLRAEAEELEAKEVYAKQGIEVDVRRAYLGLKEAEERLEAATEAYKTGKKWLTGEAIAFGSGLGGVQGLVEAYGARAETAKSYFEAVFRHHMAWADLSRAVGKEIDPLLIP
jgi:outer membrane protein TolC